MPSAQDIRASVDRNARRIMQRQIEAAHADERARRAAEDDAKNTARRREDAARALRRANEDDDRHARRDVQLAARLAKIEAKFGL